MITKWKIDKNIGLDLRLVKKQNEKKYCRRRGARKKKKRKNL